MTNSIIKIVNAETGEEIEREMTAEEIKQKEIDDQLEAKLSQIKAEKAAAKADLLNRLGISEAEARLLLS